MKELLKKAFEAGKDRQYNIEWQLGRGKPDFEEWYKEHKSEVLDLHNVRLSLLDKVKEIAFGDGSAQERMVDIKALFSNEV